MLKTKVVDCLKQVIPEKIPIEVLIPENDKFGHYATNVALRLAKLRGENPIEIAAEIKSEIKSPLFEKIEVAEPGFINFWLKPEVFQEEIKEILKEKFSYAGGLEKKNKINIEFISVNPTGPLHIGHGRGGFCGDVLANILEKAGYQITREYYLNDAGEQIKKLCHSILGDAEAVYRGEYLEEMRKTLKKETPEKVGAQAAQIILKKMIKPTVKKMGIKFDVWFSEKSLYQNKEVDKVLDFLKKKKLIYEKDSALWFSSTKFGDDKDRVLIKAGGEKTYFASDIAYLKNKFERGFDKLIIILGADHYGYLGRIKAAAQALGYDKEKLVFIIIQLARFLKNGRELKMSKRAGTYVTVDELLVEVGLDAARFFFLMNSPETHMDFDLNLAKEQSLKNPVYYVQYAAVRAQSIIRKFKIKNSKLKINFGLLNTSEDINLMRVLVRFPEIIEEAAKNYSPQVLVRYALVLAKEFHNFYEKERIIPARRSPGESRGAEKDLMLSRLVLIQATQIIFKNLFDLLGIKLLSKM